MVLKIWNRRTNGWTYFGAVARVDKYDGTFRLTESKGAAGGGSRCVLRREDVEGGETRFADVPSPEDAEVMFGYEDATGLGIECKYFIATHENGSELGVCYLDAVYLLNEQGKTVDKL